MSLKKSVVVADFRVTGNEHLMINGAVLEGLLAEGWEVEFLAAASHVEAIRKNFDLNAVHCISLGETFFANRVITFFKRELGAFSKLYKVIKRKVSTQSSKVIITTLTPMGHLLFRIADLIFGMPGYILLLHAELEQLNPNKRNSFSRFAMRFWASLNKIKRGELSYICLSKHIENAIVTLGVDPNRRIAFLMHPFSSNFCFRGQGSHPNNKALTIGVPGLIRSDTKRVDDVFKIGHALYQANSFVTIRLIGRAVPSFCFPEFTNVEMPFRYYDRPINQELFDAELEKADFLMLLYDQQSYSLTASGAIFDALKYNKPVLAYRNPLFDYLKEKNCFPGVLFGSWEEIVAYVESLCSPDAPGLGGELYKVELENLKAVSNSREFARNLML